MQEQYTKDRKYTERIDKTPLLGMDWMKPLKVTIRRIQLVENNQSGKEKIINKFPDIFERHRNKYPVQTRALSGNTQNSTDTITSTSRCGKRFTNNLRQDTGRN